MTLADAQAELTAARTAYLAALNNVSGSHGDKSWQRQNLRDLAAAVTRAQRSVNVLTAEAQGITNPGIVTPRWT